MLFTLGQIQGCLFPPLRIFSCLGLDSQFASVETVLTAILDYYPRLRPRKTMVVAGVCLMGFVFGLPFCCPGGSFLLDLLDYYAASWPFLFIVLMEFIIIGFIYGYSNYIDDLFEMTRSRIVNKMKKFLSMFYSFLSPTVIFVILVASWYSYQPLVKGDYIYPVWANAIGWGIALTSILSVPVLCIVVVIQTHLNNPRPSVGFVEIIREMTRHTEEWRQNAINANAVDGDLSEFEYRMEGDRRVRRPRGLWEEHRQSGRGGDFCSLDTFNFAKEGFANVFNMDKVPEQQLLNNMF
eukprot:GFUD01060406.1.p1 GENE.GFUD01060406.1~~GFUD01060406.1.p1  ORF type:complete len:295 (-),score=48.27 GFUD01060406.1:8-892(-)